MVPLEVLEWEVSDADRNTLRATATTTTMTTPIASAASRGLGRRAARPDWRGPPPHGSDVQDGYDAGSAGGGACRATAGAGRCAATDAARFVPPGAAPCAARAWTDRAPTRIDDAALSDAAKPLAPGRLVLGSQPVGEAGGEAGVTAAIDGPPGGVTGVGGLTASGGVGAHPPDLFFELAVVPPSPVCPQAPEK